MPCSAVLDPSMVFSSNLSTVDSSSCVAHTTVTPRSALPLHSAQQSVRPQSTVSVQRRTELVQHPHFRVALLLQANDVAPLTLARRQCAVLMRPYVSWQVQLGRVFIPCALLDQCLHWHVMQMLPNQSIAIAVNSRLGNARVFLCYATHTHAIFYYSARRLPRSRTRAHF